MADPNIKYFSPGTGIDLVFNLDSQSPVSRSSIIFDCDYKKKIMVVAQSTPPILKSSQYKQLHVSTLVKKELAEVVRYGFSCSIEKIIGNYKLANRKTAPAIFLKYYTPSIEVNIRSAYRLHPSQSFDVMGKIIYNNEEFFSGRHFKIHNISITGAGLLIPKFIAGKVNPLNEIEPGKEAIIGLILKIADNEDDLTTVTSRVRFMRANSNYNKKFGFSGVKFERLRIADEEELSKFIHEAQLHEIRHLNIL